MFEFRHVLDDFNMARFKFPEEEDLKTVGEVLQLSQDALNQDPHQLPGQLIGRIAHVSTVKLPSISRCCNNFYLSFLSSFLKQKNSFISLHLEVYHCLFCPFYFYNYKVHQKWLICVSTYSPICDKPVSRPEPNSS